jgi:omega-6 fatty acid desaturase (delta-12 desaturase)
VLCWVLVIAATGSLPRVPLMIVAAGLLIRLFGLQHDCGHHSLFKSARANNIVGSCLGVLMCTPYFLWRYTHALHHKASGKFDRRDEVTDIYTMTVDEYARAPRWYRIGYRVFFRTHSPGRA